MADLRVLLGRLDRGELSYKELPHFSILLLNSGPDEFPQTHRVLMRLIRMELTNGSTIVLEQYLHWLHMSTISRSNQIHPVPAKDILGSFFTLAKALVRVFAHLLPPNFQPEEATEQRLISIGQTFDCIGTFCQCLEMNNTSFAAVLPHSVYQDLLTVHFDVWMFYSRYLRSNKDFAGDMANISRNFYRALSSPFRFAEKHPKIMGYLDAIPDCVELCISNFAATRRLRDEFSRTAIFSATYVFKDIIGDERCPDHMDKLDRNPTLTTLIIQNAHRILNSPLPIHTDVHPQFTNLAFIIRLEVGNFAANLTDFDRARTLACGLNVGLWGVCQRLLLLGQCPCPKVPSGRRVCPWSASILGKDGQRMVREALELVAGIVVELLLEGQLSLFRQMEKALRRDDNMRESLRECLPELDDPQWKLRLGEIMIILDKRRTYSALERPDLCANLECPKETCAAKDLRWCRACHLAFYCSRECQKVDWRNGHEIECQVLLRPHKYPEIASNVDDDFVEWLSEDSPHFYISEEEDNLTEEG